MPNVSDLWMLLGLAMVVIAVLYASQHAKDCPECGGSGLCTVSDGVKIPCAKCDGTGKV